MKPATLTMVLAIVWTNVAIIEGQSLTPADVERFADSAFADYLRNSPEPSLAFVVVKDGKVLFARGYGHEDAARRRAVDPDSTVFWMASLSKLITADAVLREVERGRLALDAPVDRYLNWQLPSRLGWPPVTLEHLLTHTSGLDEPFMVGTVENIDEVTGLGEYLARVRWRAGSRPGDLLRYSNHGMALAGGMVERVSTFRFAEYVEREVFRPLGMMHSTFRQPPGAELARRIATAGTDARVDYLLPVPAGAMIGTPSDLGRFLIAQLDITGPRAKALQLMHATHWRAHPGVPGVALGWFETELGGVRGLYHTGARHHFSVAWIAPSKRTGIFLVHSMRQGGRFQNLRTEVIRGFAARYFQPDSASTRAIAGHGIDGVYRPMLLATTTIERAGYLFLDTRVRTLPDGRITLAAPGGLGRITAEPVGDRLFEVTTGPQSGLRLGFLPDRRPVRLALGGTLLDPLILTRLAWWQRGFVHLILLAASCSALALTSLVQAIGWIRRRQRGMRLEWPWRIVTGAGLAFLLALGTFLVVVATTPEVGASQHMRAGLRIVLLWLSLAALLGAALPLGAAVAWWRGVGSLTGKILLSILSIAGIVSAALLWHYNLVGFYL